VIWCWASRLRCRWDGDPWAQQDDQEQRRL
jgi:hypothetical protein